MYLLFSHIGRQVTELCVKGYGVFKESTAKVFIKSEHHLNT